MERKIALKETYSNMEEKFKKQNLNLEFISSIARNYEEVDDAKQRGTEMRALPYEVLHACRLIVFPMDYDPALAQKLFQAAFKVMELLPEDIKVTPSQRVRKMSSICRSIKIQLRFCMLLYSIHRDPSPLLLQRMR